MIDIDKMLKLTQCQFDVEVELIILGLFERGFLQY